MRPVSSSPFNSLKVFYNFYFFHWILKYWSWCGSIFLQAISLFFTHAACPKLFCCGKGSILSPLWDTYRSAIAHSSARSHGKGKRNMVHQEMALTTSARKCYLWSHFIEQSKSHSQYREEHSGPDTIYHNRS